MLKPLDRDDVITGGSASKHLPTIAREAADLLGCLTCVCTACASRLQCEAYQRRCPLFQPHHAEQVSEGLSHRLLCGESAYGNTRRKIASEANPEGDCGDKQRDDLLLIGDVIKRTKLSLRKLRYDMASGALTYHKFGRSTRFAPDDVQSYMDARRIGRRRNTPENRNAWPPTMKNQL
jgi:hypothetical protein